MYNNKLAVALKSAGKVLREFGETVYVPFGSEYSVLIKNLNNVRALVKVEIDGVDVGDGTRFVLDANSSVELERFIKNGNLKNGNRFKFIERTSGVEKHRGVGLEDGIVRIEFNYEQPVVTYTGSWNWEPTIYRDGSAGPFGGEPYYKLIGNSICNNANSANYSCNIDAKGIVSNEVSVNNAVKNEAGITVAGSVSEQKFQNVDSFLTESETHVIVLQMLGQTEDNQQVTKPVTVKAKPKCTTCGRVNKATAKFCTECGTSLQIV
jgi:hypothetical protein